MKKSRLLVASSGPHNRPFSSRGLRLRKRSAELLMWLIAATVVPIRADASLFEGDQLDLVANVMSWVVIVVAPVIAIGIFWILHIMPEKIAERRHHPQAKAIQCLCLLSLVFGGLLWPLAWLWAYSKPVLHKMAYGTDVDETHGHRHGNAETMKDIEALSDEASMLRHRVAELEAQLNDKGENA